MVCSKNIGAHWLSLYRQNKNKNIFLGELSPLYRKRLFDWLIFKVSSYGLFSLYVVCRADLSELEYTTNTGWCENTNDINNNNNAVTIFTSGCYMHQTPANRLSAVHGSCRLRLRLPVTCLFGTELAPQSLLGKSIKLQPFFNLKGEKNLTDLKLPPFIHPHLLCFYWKRRCLVTQPQVFVV